MNIDRRMSQQKLEELGDLIYKIRQYAELKKDVELYVMADRANGEMGNVAAALDIEDRREATTDTCTGKPTSQIHHEGGGYRETDCS